MTSAPILWFATKGSGTNEALRMQTLLSKLPGVEEIPFSKKEKWKSLKALFSTIRKRRPKLVVMEGTGIAGGAVCLLSNLLWKTQYMVSSGDAVGPFIATHVPVAGLAAAVYERLLCRFSAGFIGWTPYLCGRAMTFGARRAVTAPGWVIAKGDTDDEAKGRSLREKWGIPAGKIVVGLLGALDWNAHWEYCYGWELVKCAQRIQREDMVFLVVGNGSGLERLREEAGDLLNVKVFLPGPVKGEDVLAALSTMNMASLPQSMDGVGLFRYTTKISEYAAAGLPVITSRIPMAYDVGEGWMWRLPGYGPWEEAYVASLTELLENLDEEEMTAKVRRVPKRLDAFRSELQVEHVTKFIQEWSEETAS